MGQLSRGAIFEKKKKVLVELNSRPSQALEADAQFDTGHEGGVLAVQYKPRREVYA